MDGRRIELAGAGNFRDIGGFRCGDGREVLRGHVYRSDALHRLVETDIIKLDGLGIETVFDLRSDEELRKDGVGEFAVTRNHVHVPLVAVSLSPFDEAIDWSVMDLRQRYIEMLETGGAAIRTIFSALAQPKAPPVVFHCTGGKDRTGVVAALLLRVLGVDDAQIVADYALSEQYLSELLMRYREQLLSSGLDRQAVAYLTSSPPDRMRYTLGELDRRWGSTADYLTAIGVPGAVVEALRHNLLSS